MKTSSVHFQKIISYVNYSVTQKNQTKPPFFHACHSYTLIKFEYFSRQKVIRGVNKFVVYDLVQSCSRNKPHILGTKILLPHSCCCITKHWGSWSYLRVGKLQVCPDSQIRRRSLFYLYWIYYQLDWCIFVSFVQLDVAYVWRQINAKIIDHWVALCGRKTAVGCLFACSSKAKKTYRNLLFFKENSRKRLHVL